MPHPTKHNSYLLDGSSWLETPSTGSQIWNNIYIKSSKDTSIWLTDSLVKFKGALQLVSSGTAELIPTVNNFASTWTVGHDYILNTAANQYEDGLYRQWKAAVKPPNRRRQAAITGWATRRENVARRLLLSLLDDVQRESFEKNEYFDIISEKGNLYRLRWGWSHNVKQLDPVTMKPILQACCHPREKIPNSDNLIGQMLYLQTNEEEFLKIANITRLDNKQTPLFYIPEQVAA